MTWGEPVRVTDDELACTVRHILEHVDVHTSNGVVNTLRLTNVRVINRQIREVIDPIVEEVIGEYP
jgi:hypothetical protein